MNPFADFWNFLIGNTEDYNALGSWKYLLVALFLALIVASVAIAVQNWREIPRNVRQPISAHGLRACSSAACGSKACSGSCRFRSRPV